MTALGTKTQWCGSLGPWELGPREPGATGAWATGAGATGAGATGAWGHGAWGHRAPAALRPAGTGEPSRGACPLRSAGARGRPGPGPYLEVGGALEGLPAHGAHVDALPPVRLLAVLQQQRRGREAAATLRALLQPALLLGLAARRQARRDVGHLQRVRMP